MINYARHCVNLRVHPTDEVYFKFEVNNPLLDEEIHGRSKACWIIRSRAILKIWNAAKMHLLANKNGSLNEKKAESPSRSTQNRNVSPTSSLSCS